MSGKLPPLLPGGAWDPRVIQTYHGVLVDLVYFPILLKAPIADYGRLLVRVPSPRVGEVTVDMVAGIFRKAGATVHLRGSIDRDVLHVAEWLCTHGPTCRLYRSGAQWRLLTADPASRGNRRSVRWTKTAIYEQLPNDSHEQIGSSLLVLRDEWLAEHAPPVFLEPDSPQLSLDHT